MEWHLIRTEGQMPPGGFSFHDRITGKSYNDTHTLFADRVREIIRDRLANKRLFTDANATDFNAVAKELSLQTCGRLKNSLRYCTDGTPQKPKSAVSELPVKKQTGVCVACGSDNVEPIYCPTCTGKRIIRYKCLVCLKEFKP